MVGQLVPGYCLGIGRYHTYIAEVPEFRERQCDDDPSVRHVSLIIIYGSTMMIRLTTYTGIGQCKAYALARHGIQNLALVNRNPVGETVANLRENFPHVHLKVFQLDITYENYVNQSVRDTAAAFGRLDVDVNNAGVAGAQHLTHEAPLLNRQRMVNTNLTGN